MYCLVIKDRLMRSKVKFEKKKKEKNTLKSKYTRVNAWPEIEGLSTVRRMKSRRNANNLLHSRPKNTLIKR